MLVVCLYNRNPKVSQITCLFLWQSETFEPADITEFIPTSEITNQISAGAPHFQPGQTSEPALRLLTAQLAGVSHFASMATGSQLSDQNDHR